MREPPSSELLALAVGLAAKISVRFGLSQTQAARLMSSAWDIVQDMKELPSEDASGCDSRTVTTDAV